MRIDYHTHPLAHGGVTYSSRLLSEFIETAVCKELDEIGFTEHDEFLEMVDFTCIETVKREFPRVKVRVGLEVNHEPGLDAARRRGQQLSGVSFDYLIGSVHLINGWMFDHPDQADRYNEWDIDELYTEYFRWVADAAASKEYQIIGHLDVIKVFDYRPRAKTVDLAEPALQAIRRSGTAVEINTNGLHKPVGEIYPGPDLLERCFNYNIPVTLGSDAHRPYNVGRDIDLAITAARNAGYRKMATFENLKMIVVPLG